MTITECGGFLRMGGCTKMQSDEAHIIIKECFSQTSSFHLVQFSSVQFNGVPRRPDHLRRKRSGRHGAAQLAWLDERCLHGLVPGVFTASWEVTGVLYRGGVIKLPRAFLPAAGAKILAMLTVNHYIYALKLMPLTRY